MSFAGHWDVEFAVPGVGVTVGFSSSHEHASPSGTNPLAHHRDHCHVDASGCSDQPLVSGAQVAHLGEMISLAASFDADWGVVYTVRAQPDGAVTLPDIPPPRAS